MLMPVGDDNSDRRIFPLVNYFIIAANVFVFVFFQQFGINEKFTLAFSTVPAEIVSGKDIVTDDEIFIDPTTGERIITPGLQQTPIPVYLTLITSMFMHGSLAHIFGNMLFLLIFGDNIENRIGHFRYFLFYLVCGIIASLSQVMVSIMFESNTLVPSLGASGAISGVLGGYILLFPKRRVHVMIFYQVVTVSAFFAIGLWFVFQLINGIGVLGSSQSGGVAYAAHIGGFIAGFLLIKFFDIGKR